MMSILTEHTEWLRSQLSDKVDPAQFDHFVQALQEDPVVSIRVNPDKWKEQITLEKIPWCQNGYYLPVRPGFTFDPLLHGGAYYVQEASSMFLDHIVRSFLDENQRAFTVALDACAAPGGKTTLLANALKDRGCVIANEVIQKRFKVLEENVLKWGSGNIIPVNRSVKEFSMLHEKVDLLVIDAPCSGEGMWRKDVESVTEWSKENVMMCADRQHQIISDLLPALSAGGWLVYSTCTYNTAENEAVAEWILQQYPDLEPVMLDVPADWNIITNHVQNATVYRFLPGLVKGEGFSVSVWRKQGLPAEVKWPKAKLEGWKEIKTEETSQGFQLWHQKEGISLMARERVFRVASALGTEKVSLSPFYISKDDGKKVLPDPALAWRTDIHPLEFYEAIDLDAMQAIRFLRCDTSGMQMELPAGVPYLVQYKGVALGFMRKIGNSVRIDYPYDYRILKVADPVEILL